MKRRCIPLALVLLGCHSPGPVARHTQPAIDSAGQASGDSAVVIREATLVVFVLPASDTLKGEDEKGLLDEFRYYTERVTDDLGEAGIPVLSTRQATITVRLESGPSRRIMLSGLDYPFGYVLVEPGYPEVIMTGVTTEEELLDEAGWYFGFDDGDAAPGDQQIALAPRRP